LVRAEDETPFFSEPPRESEPPTGPAERKIAASSLSEKCPPSLILFSYNSVHLALTAGRQSVHTTLGLAQQLGVHLIAATITHLDVALCA